MTYTVNNTSPYRGFRKSSVYGMVGTVLSCAILFLIMWFYIMPYTQEVKPVEEEGLMISFGNSDEGGGQGEELMGTPDQASAPSNAEETTVTQPAEPVRPVTTTTTKVATSSNDYITQQEASLAIAEKKRKDQEKQAQIAADSARIANEKRIADQKRKEQDAINKASSSMSGLFGNSSSAGNGNGTGSGSGEGPGHQGNPAGKGYAGGHSWSLNGRSLTSMVQPSYDKDIEGKITVNIRVDAGGKVVSTSIGSPTTISDQDMRNAAMSAATRARFSTGNSSAAGSITFNFRLK